MTQALNPVVHLVEDDDSMREATARFLRANGHIVRTYENAIAFLESTGTFGPGCLVLDLRLPGLSGLELQEVLHRLGNPLPIVFVSGIGDLPGAVRAMKGGAVDFLPKDADGAELLDAVGRALARDAGERERLARRGEVHARYDRLSPREKEVFAQLIAGQLNKQVGYNLGITEHTVKIHRGRVLQKMEARSVAELVRLADEIGVHPIGG